MDVVDPALVNTAEAALREVPGVVEVGELRMRWIGHQLRAEAAVVIDGSLPPVLRSPGRRRRRARPLLHAVPRLTAALIHPDPTHTAEEIPHTALAHHAQAA